MSDIYICIASLKDSNMCTYLLRSTYGNNHCQGSIYWGEGGNFSPKINQLELKNFHR